MPSQDPAGHDRNGNYQDTDQYGVLALPDRAFYLIPPTPQDA